MVYLWESKCLGGSAPHWTEGTVMVVSAARGASVAAVTSLFYHVSSTQARLLPLIFRELAGKVTFQTKRITNKQRKKPHPQ